MIFNLSEEERQSTILALKKAKIEDRQHQDRYQLIIDKLSVAKPVQHLDLKRGEVYVIGKKIYGVCYYCGSLVRQKPILGGLHLCNFEDDGK